MDRKIKNYVDTLFLDIPRSKKATRLKNELIDNMTLQYKGHIEDGKAKTQAYALVVAGFSDVDDILCEAQIPDEEDESDEQSSKYKMQTFFLEVISVILFMVAPIVSFASVTLGIPTVGIFVLPILIIIGYILSLYVLKSRRSKDKQDSDYQTGDKFKKYLFVISLVMATSIYVIIGTITNLWHPTWLVFFLVPISTSIFDTILELINLKGEVNET